MRLWNKIFIQLIGNKYSKIELSILSRSFSPNTYLKKHILHFTRYFLFKENIHLFFTYI